MGTARIASDPRRGVCAPNGSVNGAPGLYVADASLFPTSVGVNPMMTIIAFAKQVAREVATAAADRPARSSTEVAEAVAS
jgi:choline dehydrogenase-like flavoprotein